MSLASLREFVPGLYVVPENPVMRGQGVGSLRDFVAGRFAVPQNPVLDAGMGDLLSSTPLYPIPLNSVMANYNQGGASWGGGLSGLGCGGDCGCGGKCGGGMGQLSLTSITAPFTTAFADIQAAIAAGSITPLTTEDWLVIGGTAAAAWFLFGKKGRR